MKNSPRPLLLLHQTLPLALCIEAGCVLLAPAKHRFVRLTGRWWRRFLCTAWFSIQWSSTVSLCGLPLHGWDVVSPRHFQITITALTVDRGSSSRTKKKTCWTGGILWWCTLKVTELFSYGHSTANVCHWRLHGCVLYFIHLSATGVGEIPDFH